MHTTTHHAVRARRGVAVVACAIVLLSTAALGPSAPAGGAPAPDRAPSGASRGHPSETSMDPIPPQYPFVCTTAREGLGQPKVDNQDEQGIPVALEDANGDYPKDGRGYPTAEAEIVGLEPGLRGRPRRRVPLPRSTGGQILPLADPDRSAARRHRDHDHHGRRHRAVRDPLRARHDQPLHLLHRHAGPGHRDRPARAPARPVERAAALPLRRRGGHRPLPGPPSTGRTRCTTPRCRRGTPSSPRPAPTPAPTTT